MRIVHTSDWHAGRIWKRMSRLDELERVLDSLARFVESDKIDLVLMTGDVFDSGSPSAEAERLVFRVLKRLGKVAQVIVLAGNHDDPKRLEAWGQLAELANIRTLGRPRSAKNGGVIEVHARGETAIIAAVPFAQLRDFVSAAELAEDEQKMRGKWSDELAKLVHKLCASFRTDTINILAAHTHVEGAKLANSERIAQIGEQYALAPERLPTTAQYVALGHIHRPQQVTNEAHYAGSPLQLDFGEAGEEKSFVVLDVVPGLPAKIGRVPYQGGTALYKFVGTMGALLADAEALRQAGHVRVELLLAAPDPDAARRVRAEVPNAITIITRLPEVTNSLTSERADQSAIELYTAYHQQRYGRAPEEPVLQAFAALYEQAGLGVEPP